MPRDALTPLPITFEKDLQESQEDSVLPPGAAALLENWVPEPTGGLRCRRGWNNGSTLGAPTTRRSRGFGFFASESGIGDVKTKVGSFSKAASLTQAVSGLGFQPKAIIFFSNYPSTATGFVDGTTVCLGFTTGPTQSYATSMASAHTASPSASSRRMAAKAFTAVAAGTEATVMEADLTSFDSDGFTLAWSSATGGGVINYLAIGGSAVLDAKAVQWNTGTVAGDVAVSGVGFQPSLVLHTGVGQVATALPVAASQGVLEFGAMDASGNQWANNIFIEDAVNPLNSTRTQRIDSCLVQADNAINKRATFSSMDADGFTVNFATAPTITSPQASLCLRLSADGRARAGSFTKDTGAAPDAQSVSGLGMTPTGLLFSSWGRTASTAVQPHGNWSLGSASLASAEKGVGIRDEDAVAVSDVQGYQNDFILTTLDEATPSTVDAQADLLSLDTDGFSLNWTTNDADADEILYLALGGVSVAGTDYLVSVHNDLSEYDISFIRRSDLSTGTWAAVESVASTDPSPPISFAQGLGGLMYVNERFSVARRWTGSGAGAAVAGSPAGRFVAFKDNRFFIGGSNANPTRLWYSDLGSYSTWGAASYLDIDQNDGDYLVDGVPFEDGVLLAKTHRLFFLAGSGPDDFDVNPLSTGGGFPGRCICLTPYGAVIAQERAVWLWSGGGVELISKPIEDSYRLTGSFVTTAYVDGVTYICDQGTGTIFALEMELGNWTLEKVASPGTDGPAAIAARLGHLYYGPQQSSTVSLAAYRESPGGDRARDAAVGQTFRVWTPEIWPLGPEEVLTPRHLHIKYRQRGGNASQPGVTIIPVYDGTAITARTIPSKASAGTYRTTLHVGDDASGKGIRSVQFRAEQTLSSSEASLIDIEEMTLDFVRVGNRA